MHIAREYAFADAATAVRMGVPLEQLGNPYEVGFLFVEDDETGERFTTVGNAAFVRLYKQACDMKVMGGVKCPALPLIRAGWPDEWGTSATQGADSGTRRTWQVGIQLPSSNHRSAYWQSSPHPDTSDDSDDSKGRRHARQRP